MVDETLTTEATGTPSVVLVGAAHLDRIAVSDGPFRPGFSNPGHVVERLGGAAFNAALALRAFGADTHLVSASGGDEAAERIGRALDAAGIGDGRIVWLDRRSATYTALVDAGGDLIGGVADMGIYDRLAPRVLSRRHLKARLAAADGLLIDANLSSAALAHLATGPDGRPVAAIAVSPAKIVRLADALPHLAMLFASRIETASLFDLRPEASDADLVEAVASTGLRRAVLTNGAGPVLVIDGSKAWRQVPPAIERVSDVVGAGDTLAGAAFGAWLSGRPFADAVRLGLAAASLRITVGLDSGSSTEAERIADTLPDPQFLTV